MSALDAVTVRRLARSILEARKEGRALTPLTNTHLLTRADALKIQDGLLDLRVGRGERLVGWYFAESGELSPLTDRMIFQAQPVGLVGAQRVDAVAVSEDGATSVELIIDRVIKGGLREDFIAHGLGLVGIIMGESVDYEIQNLREEVAEALRQRNRELLPTDLVIRPIR